MIEQRRTAGPDRPPEALTAWEVRIVTFERIRATLPAPHLSGRVYLQHFTDQLVPQRDPRQHVCLQALAPVRPPHTSDLHRFPCETAHVPTICGTPGRGEEVKDHED